MANHRFGGSSVRRFERKALIVLSSMLLILPFLNLGQALAVHDDEFQLDGNTDPADATTGGPALDWEDFFNAAGTRAVTFPTTDTDFEGFKDSAFTADSALPDGTTFATGSKDTLDIPAWQCTRSNNLGGKVDLINAYSTIFTNTAGETILYFGTERAATEGTGNMGIWFLKDPNAACLSTGKTKTWSGAHSDGDIFVVAEFSNGGTTATILAYEWEIPTGGGAGFLNPTPVATGGLCGDPDAGDQACAIVNTAPLNTIWDSPDKSKGDLDTNAFFEGGVNLGSSVTGCFATFVANTRSSTSLTATIFDYAAGGFPTCSPTTDLRLGTGTNTSYTLHSGEKVVLNFTEKNDGNVSLTKPSSSNFVTGSAGCAVVDVDTNNLVDPNTQAVTQVAPTNDGDNGGVGNSTANTTAWANNNKLDPNETWKFKCEVTGSSTLSSTIRVIGHGKDSLGRDVTWCDTGQTSNTTRLCDADETRTVAFTVINPGTTLRMSASAAVTYTYKETNTGDGPLSQPNGTTTSAVTSTTGNGGWVTDPGCGTVLHVKGTADATTPDAEENFNVGDLDHDNLLDNGFAPTDVGSPKREVWQFTCTETITGSDSASVVDTNAGTGDGIDNASTPANVTWCANPAGSNPGKICSDERDKVRVTIEQLAGPYTD
jgi:hypothetical protein